MNAKRDREGNSKDSSTFHENMILRKITGDQALDTAESLKNRNGFLTTKFTNNIESLNRIRETARLVLQALDKGKVDKFVSESANTEDHGRRGPQLLQSPKPSTLEITNENSQLDRNHGEQRHEKRSKDRFSFEFRRSQNSKRDIDRYRPAYHERNSSDAQSRKLSSDT